MRESDSGVFLQILTAAILIVIFFFSIPACSSCQNQKRMEKSRMISCRSNLKQIGIAMKLYSGDYNDNFPDRDNAEGLEQLRSGAYLMDYKIYKCPSTTTICAKAGSITEMNSDYIYFGGLTEKEADKNIIIAIDKQNNHKNYVNVLYGDGQVSDIKMPDGIMTNEMLIRFLYRKTEKTPMIIKQIEKAKKLDSPRLRK